MFRKGGSAGEGITSGLAPRQGYQEAGDVKQNDLSKVDLRNMDMQQIKDLANENWTQAVKDAWASKLTAEVNKGIEE